MRLNKQQTLGVGIYASTPRGRSQENPSSHNMGCRFLLRAGGSKEFLGSWINSGAIHEAKKRRLTQVITCSFPCGKWLHVIGVEYGQAHVASSAEESEDNDKKRLNTCRKKQCRTFKVGSVKRKGRASVGSTTGVGSIFSAPPPNMGRRNEKKRKHKVRQLESLWRETKIGDVSPWEDIADEAEGLLAIRRRESYLLVIDSVTSTARLAEMPHTKVTMMQSRRMTKSLSGMKRSPTTRSFWAEGDLTLSWLIGPTKSFLCWDSSVHRIKDETTGSGETLEQWLNTTSSSEAGLSP